MLQFHDQKVTFSNIFTLQNNVFFFFSFPFVKVSVVDIAEFIPIIHFIISDIVSSSSNVCFLSHFEDLHFSQIVHIFSVNFVSQFYFEYIIYINKE